MAEAVYRYLCTNTYTGAEVNIDSLPDPVLVLLLREVLH